MITRKLSIIVVLAAAVAWLGAATIIIAGALTYGGTHAANLVISALLYLAGGAFLWRARVTRNAYNIAPNNPAMVQLMRSDLVFNFALWALGAILVAMASYRVFFENLPVFG